MFSELLCCDCTAMICAVAHSVGLNSHVYDACATLVRRLNVRTSPTAGCSHMVSMLVIIHCCSCHSSAADAATRFCCWPQVHWLFSSVVARWLGCTFWRSCWPPCSPAPSSPSCRDGVRAATWNSSSYLHGGREGFHMTDGRSIKAVRDSETQQRLGNTAVVQPLALQYLCSLHSEG